MLLDVTRKTVVEMRYSRFWFTIQQLFILCCVPSCFFVKFGKSKIKIRENSGKNDH